MTEQTTTIDLFHAVILGRNLSEHPSVGQNFPHVSTSAGIV